MAAADIDLTLGECAWCCAPATTLDEDADPACEDCCTAWRRRHRGQVRRIAIPAGADYDGLRLVWARYRAREERGR